MVKAAEILHETCKRNFTGMPKGGVAQIVRETNGLHQIFVAAQSTRERSSNLSNFEGMREARPKVIAFVVDEDLGLIFEAPKTCCVKDSIPVPLKRCTVFRLVIQIGAAFRIPAAHAIRSKAFVFYLFKLLASEIHAEPWMQTGIHRHCDDTCTRFAKQIARSVRCR